VPEELAFQQRFRHGRAIQRHKRLISPRAVFVNRVRRQLLPGAAFSANQHRRIARRHAFDELIHLAHARAAPHHVVRQADFRAQPLIFASQPFQPPRIFNRHHSKARDRRKQTEIILGDRRPRARRLQINRADRFFAGNHWHAQNRRLQIRPVSIRRMRDSAQLRRTQQRNFLLDHPPHDLLI